MTIYRFGEFEFDSLRDELRMGGKTVALQTKVAQLLELFLRQPGAAITHENLKAGIWPETEVADASVYRLISDTRQVLGDDPKHPTFIKTLAGRGYKFGYPVESGHDPKPSRRFGRMIWAWALVPVLAVVVWWVAAGPIRPHLEPLRSQNLGGDFYLCDSDGNRLLLFDGSQKLSVVEGKRQWLIPVAVGKIWSAVLLGDAAYVIAGESGANIGLFRIDLDRGSTENIQVSPTKADWDVQTQNGRLRMLGWPVDGDAMQEHPSPKIIKYIGRESGKLGCAVPAMNGEGAKVLLWHPGTETGENVTPNVSLTLSQACVTDDGSKAAYLARTQNGEWRLLVQDLTHLSLSEIDLEGASFSEPVWHGKKGVVLKSGEPQRFQYVSLPAGRQTLLPEVTILPESSPLIFAKDTLAFQARLDELSFLNLESLPDRR